MLTFLIAVPTPTAKDQADALRSQRKLRVTVLPIDQQNSGLYVGFGLITDHDKTIIRAGVLRPHRIRKAA